MKQIFTMYDEGKTISEITKSLNERGLKTRKGFDFRIGSVSLILKTGNILANTNIRMW